jgi:deazaflavin-dependent oxidoreductase (nitroreductase family)
MAEEGRFNHLLPVLGPVVFLLLWSGVFIAARIGVLDTGPLTFLVVRKGLAPSGGMLILAPPVGAVMSSYEDFNRMVMEDLRANSGKATSGPFAGRELLILTTEGAKTRRKSDNPLAFIEDGDRYVVIASKGGAPTNPAWYHNLIANPEVEVEVRGERFPVHAATLTEGDEYERLYKKQADRFPGFWEYRQKTDRKIPVVVFDRVNGRS